MDFAFVHSAANLADWLGIQSTQRQNGTQGITITARFMDPKRRFIYIYGDSSRTRLKITRSMLAQIFTYHQVMPDYLDFIFAFGFSGSSRLLKFSSFREHTSLRVPQPGSAIPQLGRSGRQFQLCYNLKGTWQMGVPDDVVWMAQEAAFYHQFDVLSGNMLWIVTKGRLDLHSRIKDWTNVSENPDNRAFGTVEDCFRSSLSTQLLFSHWSTEGWRNHIEWLYHKEQQGTYEMSERSEGPGEDKLGSGGADIQQLQWLEDRANEIIGLLEGNVYVLGALQKFYLALSTDSDFPLRPCGSDINTFSNKLGHFMEEFRMQVASTRTFVKSVADRKELINKYIERQAAQRAERLNRNMEREAVVVRIVTIVTLIYLPATFVSTFFSTDIIKYQSGDKNGTFSPIAMNRWLQVTLPLTFLTILVAWLGDRWAQTHRPADNRLREGERPCVWRRRFWPNAIFEKEP
ncbi:hypothetical protein NA57DRAFT_79509 [Rhizodiscina lignyota]|uniref:CorA-like transporter domain-containing protein n=1 Tax=Rhizodiscina lignyota TaxID=1504668 RepID=A0A9P4M6N4_9PEZI|nr:hypothetical protein NA57DRAFT_79509 [Rhizodiscina lignyota]